MARVPRPAQAPRRADRPGIGIRLLRGYRPYYGLFHSWVLTEFPDSPPIVHVELLRGGVFLHDPEVTRYVDQCARLHKLALSTAGGNQDYSGKDDRAWRGTTMTVRWRKASRSGTETNCVELASTGAVRDSKNAAGPALMVDLRGFLAAIKTGRFDR